MSPLRTRRPRPHTPLSDLKLLMTCRAVVMAAELATVTEIRAMGPHQAIIEAGRAPREPSIEVMCAVADLDAHAAETLYDACAARRQAHLMLEPA